MRIALFITCFNDTLFPNVGMGTTRLPERLGITVDFLETQICCRQMHYNNRVVENNEPLRAVA